MATKEYFKTHEWIEDMGNGKFQMGISAYACDQLGDIVFVEEQANGDSFDKGSSLCILESVKAVGDVYAPFKAKLIATNPDIVASPEGINANTWLIEIEAANADEANSTQALEEADYQSYLSTL